MEIKTTELYEKIDQEVKKGKRYIFLRGSSRSGKTRSAVQYLIIHALTHPKSNILIARETAVSIRNTILLDFKEEMEKLNLFQESRFNKVEMIFRFNNQATIRFIGLDDTTGKLRGMSSDVIFIDEVNTIDRDNFIQLDIRCKNYIICAYNPEIPENWWGLEYENKDDGSLLISTWRQNPFLDERIIKSINSLKEIDYDKWLIYSESKIVQPKEKIFPPINRYSGDTPESKQIYYGVDFGYASDPTAVVKVIYKDKELFVEELIYQKGLTNQDIAFLLKQEGITRDDNVVVDSAEPKSITELNREGLRVVGVKKTSVLYGLQKMKSFKINIKDTSTNLIREWNNYKFKKDRSGNITSSPVGDDHLIDALRYVVLQYLDNINNRQKYYVY